MFLSKKQISLNESTATLVVLTNQAIIAILGSEKFFIKNAIKIVFEEVKHDSMKVTIATSFLYQSEIFRFVMKTWIVKDPHWIPWQGNRYSAAVTINEKFGFHLENQYFLNENLKFTFSDTLSEKVSHEFKKEYVLMK